MDAISKYCEDPKNPFQVKAELMVRKMLEKHTGWKFEFTRNEHQYGVDIIAYRYTLKGNSFEREEVGKIEVEASKKWKNGIFPTDWKTYSYLRRKIEAWDKTMKPETRKIWKGVPWDDGKKRVYLKCAIDLSDCHAALVSDVWDFANDNFLKEWKKFGRESRRWMYQIPFAKDIITKRGWKDCITFALKSFSEPPKAQPQN